MSISSGSFFRGRRFIELSLVDRTVLVESQTSLRIGATESTLTLVVNLALVAKVLLLIGVSMGSSLSVLGLVLVKGSLLGLGLLSA